MLDVQDQVLLLDAQDQHGDAAAAYDECSTAALATISLHKLDKEMGRESCKAVSVPPDTGHSMLLLLPRLRRSY